MSPSGSGMRQKILKKWSKNESVWIRNAPKNPQKVVKNESVWIRNASKNPQKAVQKWLTFDNFGGSQIRQIRGT